ncbi:hypothetical protein RhiirC2_796397 [Rhizophagus irregularis]|uniref:Uncharacterized protein n=1 Tax=Rhizophagus irregularis TaxID=588596 RepID=A0A2N1M9T6_9GLOM|nr:hypothetical protein RhiirC2_796397 [Rhizophagus irregularis]
MSAIITKYVADHKLNKDMSNEELSQHASVLLELLTDKLKRLKGRQRLQGTIVLAKNRIEQCISQATSRKGGSPSKTEVNICDAKGIYQVSDIIPEGETIRETAQRIVRDNLSERDVKAISRTLVEIASDPVVASSRLSRLRRELQILNAPEKIISAIRILDITRAFNKIQQERTEHKNEGLYFPDHFSLESVKEWLDLYVVFNTPDKQTLTDDIPWVFRSLEKNEERARQLLTWIQKAITSRVLKDPEKPGLIYLSSFLKKDEYIPKPYEPLLPSSLRKLGAVFASAVHEPKNPLKANTYASKAFRHSPDNYTSPSDRYTIVNFRRRGNLMIKQNHSGFLMKTNHIYGLKG